MNRYEELQKFTDKVAGKHRKERDEFYFNASKDMME